MIATLYMQYPPDIIIRVLFVILDIILWSYLLYKAIKRWREEDDALLDEDCL